MVTALRARAGSFTRIVDIEARLAMVRHIMPDGDLRPHALTEGARVGDSGLSYPPPQEERTPTLFD